LTALRITIVALGHRMPAWVTMGYDEYARRLPREFALELIELKPEPRSRGKSSTQVLAAEAVRIRAACAGCTVVALDENGSTWTTLELAGHIGRWRDEGARVALSSAAPMASPLRSRALRSARSPYLRSRCRTGSCESCWPNRSIGQRACSPATRIIGREQDLRRVAQRPPA